MATTTTPKKTSKNTKTTSKKSVSPSTVKKTTKTTKNALKATPASTKKVATKTAVKPVVKATKATPKRVTKAVTAARIRSMRLIVAIVSALLAVPVVLFGAMTNVSLQVPHAGNDPLLNVPVAALTTYLSIPIPYLVAGVLVIAAGFNLLRATRLQAAEQRNLTAKVMKWRWLELGVVFALLSSLVLLVAGLTNIVLVKLVAAFVLLGYFAGWLTESELPAQTKRIRLFAALQTVALAIPVIVLAIAFAATAIYGSVTYNWSVYVAALVLTTGIVTTLSLQRRIRLGADYVRAERAYLVTTFMTVVLTAGVIIAGLGF